MGFYLGAVPKPLSAHAQLISNVAADAMLQHVSAKAKDQADDVTNEDMGVDQRSLQSGVFALDTVINI